MVIVDSCDDGTVKQHNSNLVLKSPIHQSSQQYLDQQIQSPTPIRLINLELHKQSTVNLNSQQ